MMSSRTFGRGVVVAAAAVVVAAALCVDAASVLRSVCQESAWQFQNGKFEHGRRRRVHGFSYNGSHSVSFLLHSRLPIVRWI